MDEIEGKLIRCFSAVFPDLTADQIRNASPQAVSDWNSLTAVTLVAVIEDEFQIKASILDLGELDSFASLLDYISRKLSSKAAD